MANGVNKVILVGHLCADVDVRYIPSGQAVVNVRLATNESWKDRETGEREERAEFHNVVMFGRLAEVAADICARARRSSSRASSALASGRTATAMIATPRRSWRTSS